MPAPKDALRDRRPPRAWLSCVAQWKAVCSTDKVMLAKRGVQVICAACNTPNEDGRKFCGQCGASLALSCPACGTPNAPGVKFCGECGNALVDGVVAAGAPAPAVRESAAAERRLVSVLFVDLVGFTAASEGRDAEDTRELLEPLLRRRPHGDRALRRHGREVHRRRRHGGLGRAGRAGGRRRAGREGGTRPRRRGARDRPALRARAGVLTGEAAVTLGAKDQGMVAGDLVNTASRIQSAAEPGTVLTGETTKQATEATSPTRTRACTS